MALTQSQVSQLYVTLFGRASEGAGNDYWQSAAADLADGANQMLATQASQDYFGSSLDANQAFVEHIYENTLGKTYAEDPAGIDYWTGLLDSGVSRGVVVASLINAVYDYASSTDPVTLAAYNQFVNRVAVSDYCADNVEGADLDANDDAAMAEFTGYIDGVTDDPATVTAAEAEIDAADAFTLTNDTDVATANVFNAGLVWSPGGNDRINALQDEDVLTGRGTDPVLNATLGNANDNGAVVITPALNGISVINTAFTGSGGTAVTALDLQDSTGQSEVNITRVSQAVNFAEVGNLMTPAATLSLSDTNANNAGVVEYSYAANILEGDNAGTFEVENVQVGVVNIGENTSGINVAGVASNGFEDLTLTSAGAAANSIGTLNLPADTDTDGVLTITGEADLVLGAEVDVVNAANAALVEAKDVWVAGTGLAQAGGRLATIDASGFTGDLTLVLDNLLDVGKADTSGVTQDVTVTGGTGNDTFVLYDAVQVADTITGGDGDDNLLFYSGSSLASVAGSIETATMFGDGSTGNIALDFDFLPDATGMTVRNISSNFVINVAEAPVTFSLTDMTVDQAAAITVLHATTGNNQITNTVLAAAVETNTASDTLGVTIADGTNVDPRFNFTVVTDLDDTATSTTAGESTFENQILTDSDTESNSVELTDFDQFTGTITLTGGEAGDFISLDVDTAGADVTAVTTGVTPDAGGVQQGLYGLNTDGDDEDYVTGNIVDVDNLATEVRLGAATIDASAELADVIVRVDTNVASATGAQAITMGTGDDTVIFDMLNDNRAGLTISDTVDGGDGEDTLVIDGDGVRVSLGASEWTNVSNFETVRIVGNDSAALGTIVGQNSYNLVLTNDLIGANGAGLLDIINDNDINNDTEATVGSDNGLDTLGTGNESAVTLDARTLDASHHFTYNGEEGSWADLDADGVYDAGEEIGGSTVDKVILADANINGGNIIDGGALDNSGETWAANVDTIEVRNGATVTVGDLANISNVGIIAGTNDQALEQTLVLELNDTVVDAMVDSYHTSSSTEVEVLTVQMNAAADIVGAVGGAGLTLDASALTQRSQVNVALDAAVGATDSITIGMGRLTITNFTTVTDEIVIDVSRFGLTLDDDDIGVAANTDTAADGTNILFGVAAAAATDYLIFDTITTVGQTSIYYDSDGNGAQAQILIGVVDATVAATDTIIVA